MIGLIPVACYALGVLVFSTWWAVIKRRGEGDD
jgi:hypothetical protein